MTKDKLLDDEMLKRAIVRSIGVYFHREKIPIHMKTQYILQLCTCLIILSVLESCGCAGDCPVGWQPHALSPVFYGHRDYDHIAGDPVSPPGKCRVFYPTADGSPAGAPPLEGCCKYPLIILIHGDCRGDEANHYKKWFLLPAQLARSGYVVLVPSVPFISSVPSTTHPAIEAMETFRAWILDNWEFHELVHPNTGVVGHSFGAPIGASFSKANSNVKAFASLSGQYEGVNDYLTMNKPVLFMRGHPTSDLAEAFTGFNWTGTPQPKHRAEFAQGFHWDYMLASQVQCSNSMGRGECAKAPQLAAELIMMFFSRYLRRGASTDGRVPLSLIPPDLTLTTDQQFFAGGNYLKEFHSLGGGCGLNLTWATAEGSGTISKP
jgi:hypothetical protein